MKVKPLETYIFIMGNCSNTIHVGAVNSQALAKAACAPKCGQLGPVDCCGNISSRPKREKVVEQIKDYVLLRLGAPVIDIELDDQQLDLAVKHTLQIMEEYAPREYFQYYVFKTSPGKSIYEMPPDVGYIREVAYKETADFAFTASDLGGMIPVEYFYPTGNTSGDGGFYNPSAPVYGHMAEWTLFRQYEQMFAKLSSQLGGWEWIGGYRHIKLYPVPCRTNCVVVHYMQKCKDWECATWLMQEGALYLAMDMLAKIRKRFKNAPGPNGGIQLDGEELQNEATEGLRRWREELITRWGDLPPITMA